MTTGKCSHHDGAVAKPRSEACEGCGSNVNLRVCTQCGHVGCCESQKGHNKAHAHASGHPVIRELPLGERGFLWCYACNAYVG